MVEPRGETSNSETIDETLSNLFETLADWEKQLQALPPEQRQLIVSDVEEPSP